MEKIIIKGARENNLKNISLELPKNKFIVMTGVSGSGKSSLAFDTIYKEGERRYLESLSAYARQFLGGTEKPDVDSIEGLSPAISIDQTNSKLIKENIKGENNANKTHYKMGKDIRSFIKKQGGIMPEDLPTPNKSLKELEKKNILK